MADDTDTLSGNEGSFLRLSTCSWHVVQYDRGVYTKGPKKGQKRDSIKLQKSFVDK